MKIGKILVVILCIAAAPAYAQLADPADPQNYRQCLSRPIYDRHECEHKIDICFRIVINSRVAFNSIARGQDRDLTIYALMDLMTKQDAIALMDQATQAFAKGERSADEFADPLKKRVPPVFWARTAAAESIVNYARR